MSRVVLVSCDVQYAEGTCGMSVPLSVAKRDGWYLSDGRDLCPMHARGLGR